MNTSLQMASDAQVIASALGIACEDAQQLLTKNDSSIRKVLDSTKAGRAIMEVSSRYIYEDMTRGEKLGDVETISCYLCHQLRGYPYEVFAVLFLDNKHRLIEYEEMFKGTIDCATVHPREVIRQAIHHNAAAVVLAHNHPSGNTEPSQADHRITDRLKDALRLVDVRLLDHFIIGDEVLSFVERGYI